MKKLGYTKGDRNWHVVTEKLVQTTPIARRMSQAACGAILCNTDLSENPTDKDPVCLNCAQGKVGTAFQQSRKPEEGSYSKEVAGHTYNYVKID